MCSVLHKAANSAGMGFLHFRMHLHGQDYTLNTCLGRAPGMKSSLSLRLPRSTGSKLPLDMLAVEEFIGAFTPSKKGLWNPMGYAVPVDRSITGLTLTNPVHSTMNYEPIVFNYDYVMEEHHAYNMRLPR